MNHIRRNGNNRTPFKAFLRLSALLFALICPQALQSNPHQLTHLGQIHKELQTLLEVSPSVHLQRLPSSYYEPFSNLKNRPTRVNVLKDPLKRIGSKFKIPRELRPRVAFWFDIYTKYDNKNHIIHHTLYPWVIYDVVNTASILKGKGNYWTRWHRAQRKVKRQERTVRAALTKLSKRKNFKNLRGMEKKLFLKLKMVKGSRKKVFGAAKKMIRTQLGQKNFFISGLQNSTKYMAYMEEEFRQRGLPTELTRLPFVESSFNEKAQSRVGASGIWQIMPITGKSFSKVGRYIDERNSPLKATIVAAKIFKQYHRKFKSWPLTVTAYNNGIGGMGKAIRRAKSRKLHQIIRSNHKGSFKFASSNFYTGFLAALYAEKYHYEIFSKDLPKKEKLLERNVVKLKKSIRIKKTSSDDRTFS